MPKIDDILNDIDLIDEVIARNDLIEFAKYVISDFQATPFHESYYRILDAFAKGKIKKLIISAPPQHGKSLGSSHLLPSYMLGRNPDINIALGSYNATLASNFNKGVQRVMEDVPYRRLFPGSPIKDNSRRVDGDSSFARTNKSFDIIGHKGGLISTGREGALTGYKVDVMIMDDLYKDAMEGNSPTIRDNTWEWYTSVVRTRLHNQSCELIVFTRWSEDDLIGRILEKEPHVYLSTWDQIDHIKPNEWLVVNFEAVKESMPTEVDKRQKMEVLWPDRHSLSSLMDKRALDPLKFECMYQGNPTSTEGLLYGDNFKTYYQLPNNIVKQGNYTDTADMGDDYLCSICYSKDAENKIYITDVVYTREPMEKTETMVAEMIQYNGTKEAYIESNNGGRGFARVVQSKCPNVAVKWFNQSKNKEARIKTNSATVIHNIYMPHGWDKQWPDLYRHLITYNNTFRANRWHDAADVITGIVEKEVSSQLNKRSIRRIN